MGTTSAAIRDAETAERQDFEVHEMLTADERAWLDNGGIDELAAHYEVGLDVTDELPF